MKQLIAIIQKKIIYVNIFLIFLAFSFYILFFEKFDLHKTYLSYKFEERRTLLNKDSQIIDLFMNDLVFDRKISSSLQKFNFEVDKNDKQVVFIFNNKAKIFNRGESNLSKLESDTKDALNVSIQNFQQNLILQMKNNVDQINKTQDPNSSVLLQLEEYIDFVDNNKNILIIKGYNVKYRRIFLNTDEFFISYIIMLVLFNFLIRNYSKIIK